MSSLLDQAIVDAAALKEAALKNAETAILEKYSTEVKNTLDTLLEQDEGAPLDFLDEVPLAHETEGLDGLGEEEIIEIDFNDLKAALSADGEEPTPEEVIPHEEVATDIFGSEIPALPPQGTEMTPPLEQGAEMPIQEDSSLSEALIDAIAEELTVDIAPHFNISGWSSVNSADERAEEREIEEAAVAQQSDSVTDKKEQYLELYESKISSLGGEIGDLKGLLREAKDQLNHLVLENAKLVFQNKALNSTSLNERQKDKIVEAVASANTVEETRLLFETLQSAVGTRRRGRSESLREAVSRPTTSMLLGARKSEEASTNDPSMDRMLRLAGLKK